MPHARALASVRPGSLIASRYVVEHVLGKGGMGSVYAVRDTKLERIVALKYLKREAARENGPAAALFQREFHTLAQLRHPRVIQVYDYGIDGERPFYTMELLDGSDLRELAPVPWRRACQLLRDVASSLALLHSRRLLHRDLSPRNVRCTRDGQAKLIDFGTMTAMGVARDVAGTPPYMAPEAVHNHMLDARTDLYALGTLAYWTLTGYDAYPARDTRELRTLWVKPVVSPSTLAPDVPDALDALVMSLLSLDPHARPSHVAEVIERLTAIAALEPIEHMDVARAYVATPTLVGHTETLGSFQKRLVRASRGRGSAMWIEGAAGLGRSRLIQSLALEAKLSGVLVLHVEGGGAQGGGELAVTRVLLEGLLDQAPEIARSAFERRASVLGHLLPNAFAKLAVHPALETFDDPAQRVALLDHAARGLILEVANVRPVLIALDDFDKADEPSKVCISLLSRDASEHKLVVCASALAETRGDSIRPRLGLTESAARLELKPFDAEQTERLVRSVFGETPHLRAVAQWSHALSQGVPETVLELLQYLVDHRIARYERGSWTLPDSLREQPLPASVEQACELLIAELSAPARALAHPFALLTEHGALELDEVLLLGVLPDPDDTYRALLELESTGVLVCSDGFYSLRRRGLERAVLKAVLPEQLPRMHAALAAIYQARSQQLSDEALLLAAHHWHLAGNLPRCLTTLGLVADVESTRFGRTPQSIAMHVAALGHALGTGAPPAQVYALQRALVQLAASADLGLVRHAAAALSRLIADSGRADYDGLIGDPATRIRVAFGLARARYDATPFEKRGLDPVHALHELGYVASVLTGAYVTRGEIEALQHLSGVIEPLRTLSVGFELMHEMLGQAADALAGRCVLARRKQTLLRLEREGHGLEPRARTSAQVALKYWIAMDEAVQGSSSALEHAEWLAARPGFGPLAARVRGVFFLFAGDEQGADGCRKQREVLALGDPWGVTLTDARGAIYEAMGYFLCGSVLGMRRVLASVSDVAVRVQGWQRELSFVRGLYALLRGEPDKALADLERGGYAGAHALALLAAGNAAGALELAQRTLDHSQRDASGALFPPDHFMLCTARALAQAELGDARGAALRITADLAEAERAGISGMLVCALHEAGARIAIECDDRAAFRTHIRKLGATYGRGTSGLRSRYEHLGAVARRVLITVPPPPVVRLPDAERSPDVRTQIEQGLTSEQRIERAIRLLVDSAHAQKGYLFGMQSSGLRLAGGLGDGPPPEGIEDMLAFYMNAELESGSTLPRTVTGTYSASPDLVAWISDGQHLYFPVLLACTHENRRVVAGVVVIALAAQTEPVIPDALIESISEGLIAAGDVTFAQAAQ